MPVRTSMRELIALTRQLIGDVPSPQDLVDQDIQDGLDAHRDEVRYELLHAMPDIQPGAGGSMVAQFVWASYQSDYHYWESQVVVQGIATSTAQPWVVLTPLEFEYIPGRWRFTAVLPATVAPPGQWPPVFAVGRVYDVHGAAAELLDRRIALKSAFWYDVTVDGRALRLGQILDRLERLAASYRKRAWPRTITLRRDDVAPGGSESPHSQQTLLLPGALDRLMTGQ